MTIQIYVFCCNWQLLEVQCSILCGEVEERKDGKREESWEGEMNRGKVYRQTIVTVSIFGLLFTLLSYQSLIFIKLGSTLAHFIIYVAPMPSTYQRLGKKIIWHQ